MSGKRAVLVVLLLSCAAGWVAAQDLTINEHRFISPISIPINTTGVSNIGMSRLKVRDSSGTAGCIITSLRVVPSTDYGAGFDPAWISGIKVYLEMNGADSPGEYDHGSTADVVDDVLVSTGYIWDAGNLWYDISVNAAIPEGNQWKFLYVVFDYTDSAPVSSNIGASISLVTYTNGAGSPLTPAPLTEFGTAANGLRLNFDDYTVTATASGEAAATAAANETNVELFLLNLSLADASAAASLGSVKVHRLGGADNWVSNNGVLLYVNDGDANFEPGADDGVAVSTGTLGASVAGYATLTLSSSVAVGPGTAKTFWVAANMNSVNAVPGQTFGLEVENPATDITFVDEIQDDYDLLAAEYAYVQGNDSGLYEYEQTAFVEPTSTTEIPTSGNTFTVEPPDDGVPPEVATKFPAAGSTAVDRNTNITVVFNEWMKEAGAGSVTNAANFELFETLTPANTVSLGFSYVANTQTLTVDPATTLAWGIQYTFTIKATVEDYYGTALGSDYTWTFTVEAAVNPTVLAVVPEEDSADVAVESATTTIRATFSEPLKAASVGAGDLTLALANAPYTAVPGTVSYDAGTQTVVLTLGADLANDTLYRATVPASSVTDEDDLPLLAEKTWTFRTIRLYPPFTEPVIIKNRIVTGGNQQALVFVTEPPGGPADRVSVQVFTNTGRRVATLVDNLPFTSISSPIAWDGTNGKGQPLGPGLYYVQIRATKYKRVLKVLIVR